MTTTLTRRKFIQTSAAAATGLALGFHACKADDPPGVIELFKLNVDNEGVGAALNPFIFIDKNGGVTIMAPKPEIGQGAFQAIPQIIAEELGADLAKVTLKLAKGDKKMFQDQDVGGSNSVRGLWTPMRKLGAGAREMLCQAAAQRWSAPAADCRVEGGRVFNQKTTESFGFGELVEEAARLPVPKEPKLTDPKDFKFIGKPARRKDIEWKVNGTANFGIDMKKEGMVYALVEHCPTFAGSIKSLDDSAARQVKGVLDVVRLERKIFVNPPMPAVAVVADSFWAALKGKRALKIEWEAPAGEPLSTEKIYAGFRQLASQDGVRDKQKGSFSKAFGASAKQVEAEYELPFVSHSPMEPQNCLVHVEGDRCEIWSPTQVPNWDLEQAAEHLGIPQENISFHVPFSGGGFGRRLIGDFLLEACTLSKQLGKPVKLVWTREEDTAQGPFRPGSLNRLRGALDADGNLSALQHKVVAPWVEEYLFGSKLKDNAAYAIEPIAELYDVPNLDVRFVAADVKPVPVSWWRSVYSSTNAFAHECFVDEMAAAAGKDPVEFRRHLLRGDARNLKVLEKLAEVSGWSQPKSAGKGRGIALAHSFGSTAGHVVEVSKGADGKVKIDKVHAVIDCGIAVNPDNVRAQTEGCIVMALAAALKDAIVFENGRAVNTGFHNNRMLRIDEMPPVEIHLMQNLEAPGGVGEPGLPPLAPALANAIFDLTGKRIRKLPFDLAAV